MQDLIVGENECSFLRICEILTLNRSSDDDSGIQPAKLGELAMFLEIPPDNQYRIRLEIASSTSSTPGLLHDILSSWKSKFSSKATLQKLMDTLTKLNLNYAADRLKSAFLQEVPRATHQFYNQPPRALTDFENSGKHLLVLCTLDKCITKEKIADTMSPLPVFIDNEKQIFQKMHQSKRSNVMYVIMLEGNLRKVLKDLGSRLQDQVVIVTQQLIGDVLKVAESSDSILVEKDTLTWDDLTLSFQSELKSRHVKVQNTVATLQEIFDQVPEDDEEISEGFLVQLINNTVPNILSNNIPPPIDYYIQRKISPRSLLQSAHIFNNKEDIFLFFGIQIEDLTKKASPNRTGISSEQKYLREPTARYIFREMNSDFDDISKNVNKPVHLIKYAEGGFHWEKTSGDMNAVQKAIERHQALLSEENFFKQTEDRNIIPKFKFPVCISDTPGMGKSCLLQNLARMLAQEHPSRIILFETFPKFMLIFKQKLDAINNSFRISIELTLASLVKAETFATKYLQNILKSGTTNVEVMLDGFDEVPSEDQELAKKCLQEMKSICRIWVTTRPHLLHDLENCLHVLGHTIQPFDEEDQHNFLLSYWSMRKDPAKNIVIDRLKEFAKICVISLKENMSSEEGDIAGIPLQCTLLGTIMEKEAINFAEIQNGSSKPSIHFKSVTKLFQQMVDSKLEIYFAKYSSNKFTKDQLINAHVYISFQQLFPHLVETFQDTLQVEVKEMFQELRNVGLLDGNCCADEPRLLHRVIAEYFVAWFTNRLIQNPENSDEKLKLLLVSVLECEKMKFCPNVGIFTEYQLITTYKFKHPVICYFLDNLLENRNQLIAGFSPNVKMIHSCVTGNLQQLFTFLLVLKIPEVNQRFLFDEDLLLVAVRYSNSYIISCIAEQYIKERRNSKISDIVFGYNTTSSRGCITLLHVAVKCRHFTVVSNLVYEHHFQEIIEKNDEFCRTLFHFVLQDSIEDAEDLIDQKVTTLKFIAEMNKSKTLLDGKLLLDSKRFHHRLLKGWINLGVNLTELDENCQNILHLWTYCCSPIEYHQHITQIPTEAFTKLANQKDKSGSTPLELILQIFDPEPDTLQLFFQNTADIIEKLGHIFLSIIIQKNRSLTTFRELVDHGANWRYSDSNGKTLLHDAIEFGNFSIFHFLACKLTNLTKAENFYNSKNWADLQNFNLNLLNINLDPFPSPHESFLQRVLNNKINNDKHIITSMLIRAGVQINVNYDDLREVDLDSLHVLIDHGAIDSQEKAYKCLKNIVTLSRQLNISKFQMFCDKILSAWGESTLNLKDDDGNSLLHYASKYNNVAVVKYLLISNSDSDAINKYGQTPLQCAFQGYDYINLDVLNMFQNVGAINSSQNVYLALKHLLQTMTDSEKHFKLADKLLHNYFGRGLLEFEDTEGDTLLHLASSAGNEFGVKYLLSRGLDSNKRNKTGETPLHAAFALYKRESLAVVRLLVESGSDIKAKSGSGEPLIHFVLEKGNLETIEYILSKKAFDNESGSIVNFRWRRKRPIIFRCVYEWHLGVNQFRSEFEEERKKVACEALLQSARSGCKDTFWFLLEKEKDLLQDNSLNEIVHTVVGDSYESYQNKSVMGILHLVARTNPGLLECLDVEGRTPFLEQKIALRPLLWLLENVSNPRAVDNEKRNVAFVAAQHLNSVEFHKLAIHLERLDCLDLLKGRGGKSNATVLHQACLNPTFSTDGLSLFQKAGTDFRATDNKGETAIMHAAKKQAHKANFIQKLIEFGGDCKAVNLNGESALHIACQYGNLDALLLLLCYCDINAQDNEGNRPLHVAARNPFYANQTKIFQCLLEKGSLKDVRNKLDQRPYDVAVIKRAKMEIQNILRPKEMPDMGW